MKAAVMMVVKTKNILLCTFTKSDQLWLVGSVRLHFIFSYTLVYNYIGHDFFSSKNGLGQWVILSVLYFWYWCKIYVGKIS